MGSRVLVQDSVYAEMLDRLTVAADPSLPTRRSAAEARAASAGKAGGPGSRSSSARRRCPSRTDIHRPDQTFRPEASARRLDQFDAEVLDCSDDRVPIGSVDGSL